MTSTKHGFRPSNTMAYFGTLLLCQGLPFQIAPVPNPPPPRGVSLLILAAHFGQGCVFMHKSFVGVLRERTKTP